MGCLVARELGLAGLPAASGIKAAKVDDPEAEDDNVEVNLFDESGGLKALGGVHSGGTKRAPGGAKAPPLGAHHSAAQLRCR